MDAQAHLLESLDSCLEKYRKRLKAGRRSLSVEAVHDLRVAARRLLALAGLVRTVAPHPLLKKVRSALKALLGGLDDLRDTQVMLAEISATIGSLPGLRPFQHDLLKRERRLLRAASRLVGSAYPGRLNRHLEKVRLGLTDRDTRAGLSERILQAADDTYSSALLRYTRIDPAQPTTIHRARVAFRKFRYTLEIINSLSKTAPAVNLIKVRDCQNMMGDIQDAEVLLRALTDFEEREETLLPKLVRRHYEQRNSDAIAAFMKDKGELLKLWRPRPDQPLPWETKHDPVPRPARHRRRARNPARQPAPAH